MTIRTVRPAPLPDVNTSEAGGVRALHLGSEWIQGTMRIDAPFDIELEYVQRMMAWLLFVPPSSVAGRHAMQLGLGAGAITKFCLVSGSWTAYGTVGLDTEERDIWESMSSNDDWAARL